MKSAEEWEAEFQKLPINPNQAVCIVQGEDISKIQADALYHAAEYVGNLPKKYKKMDAWDGPWRAACVFARSHLRQIAADLTRSLS